MDEVYMFAASIFADNNEEFWGYIKAQDSLVRINDRGTEDRYGRGSQTMVVALQKGDKVTVHASEDIFGDVFQRFFDLVELIKMSGTLFSI